MALTQDRLLAVLNELDALRAALAAANAALHAAGLPQQPEPPLPRHAVETYHLRKFGNKNIRQRLAAQRRRQRAEPSDAKPLTPETSGALRATPNAAGIIHYNGMSFTLEEWLEMGNEVLALAPNNSANRLDIEL